MNEAFLKAVRVSFECRWRGDEESNKNKGKEILNQEMVVPSSS
jgi:hypothetical protein